MQSEQSASKTVSFPDFSALSSLEKLALALDSVHNQLTDPRQKSIVRQSIQAVQSYDSLKDEYKSLQARLIENRYQSDLAITLLTNHQDWIAENIEPLQGSAIDSNDFSTLQLAVSNLRSIIMKNNGLINDAKQILKPYVDIENRTLPEAIRQLIIESRAKNYQVNELKQDGAAGQQNIKRLIANLAQEKSKLGNALSTIEELKDEAARKSARIADLDEQRAQLDEHNQSQKNKVIKVHTINRDLEQQLKEKTQLFESKARHAEEQAQRVRDLTDELDEARSKLATIEWKLATKIELTDTMAKEKLKLLDRYESALDKIDNQKRWLRTSLVLLVIACIFIVSQII
ncbi:MAG: hypothetical protein CSB48_01135 [Proteobacteria bacterium]|nr:MAG: hypothetical protein CSB48_01135 [Pseudomonadota bacterium]PIE39882.1 MAG: hypothetical protein CSA51_03765 [Gammaproteobacteria bacterium]